MHQASEHATTAARHRLPARPTLARPEAPLTPCSAPTGGTRSHVGERKRIVFTTLGSTLTLTPNPSLLPRARSIRAAPPTAYGAGQRCPAPLPLPRTQGSIAHANKPTPEREHASKQAGQRGGGTTLSHHPKQARQHQKRKHQKANTTQAQTPNPSHPQANTPTTSLLFHHPREHKKRPHSNVWAQPNVSARREPWKSRRPARTKRRRPTRARRQRTQKRANNLVCARCAACARKGRIAREKAAHNSPRQSAWVVVFVGVFADVCRRFWAGWFGGLGVFWGCLACFLVF